MHICDNKKGAPTIGKLFREIAVQNLEAPIPSTPEFREYLIDIYRKTGGQTGHIVNHAPVLLMTTSDKGGRSHTVPVYYGKLDHSFIVIPSKGGDPEHPKWYLNMLDTGTVLVEVLSEQVRCVPRTVSGDEHNRLWRRMNEIWPSYDSYQEKTSRKIPVVVLERVEC